MTPRPGFFRAVAAIAVTGALSACAVPDPAQRASGEIFDPYENANRGVHAFNRGLDRIAFRPAARGYTNIVPDPIEDSFNAFSRNLSAPGHMVNFLLQGRLKEAGTVLARFALNTTIGFAGLADPATEFGIAEAETDFGETLYVWGIREGAYVELPVLGPSTERAAVGTLVDFFINPLSYALSDKAENIGTYAEGLERLSARGRFSDTVDSILYESEDSYAQARLIYLQNRRFELARRSGDAYSSPETDPYSDPYEDPYAE